MAGENTCLMQQWHSLRKQGVEELDPRSQFMTDFEAFLEDHLNKNKEIIVGMDVNEEDSPKAEIKQLMQCLDMINVHNHLHIEAKAPSMYQQGKNQPDFIFITSGTLLSLLTASIAIHSIPTAAGFCQIIPSARINM
eukprot:8725349-Ditylum_brightwellii.AAC.1